ncbi:hypothetical protein D3C86_1544550 [compost metagenome]
MADQGVVEGVADQRVNRGARRERAAGRASHAADDLSALAAQGASGRGGVVQIEVDDRRLGDAELGEVVVDDRGAVSIQQEALQGAEAVELVGQVHVVADGRHAAQILGLDLGQLRFRPEGADALKLLGVEREALSQTGGLQRHRITRIDLQFLRRRAGRARADQAQLALAAVDEDRARANRHRLEDAQRAEHLRLEANLRNRAGQRGHREGRVVEDVHGRHGFSPP